MDNQKKPFIHPAIHQFIAAGRPLIMVRTHEEERLGGLLRDLAKFWQLPFATWQVTSGLVTQDGTVAGTRTAEAVLAHLCGLERGLLVWLKDLHHHYDRPEVVRGLRDLYQHGRKLGMVAIISGTERSIPADLEREMAYVQLAMPTYSEIMTMVETWQAETGADLGIALDIVAGTLKGLTLAESWHALQRIHYLQPKGEQALGLLQEEKRQLIQKAGTLEYIPRVPTLDQLGGLENLKEWLSKRKQLLLSADESMREIAPKGMLLMGVSGCGKSLCVKAVSSAWLLPLYRLEMVRVFSGAFGNPEQAFVDACKLMEEMSPAILWIDEIEMGLSGEGSAAADAVLSRIFAFFLTWMQEKPPGLFVAATANRIDLLPAEMIRKGRFDQVFFVDLPTVAEREQIFRIHLQTRGYDPALFTLEVFADGTAGWNGAEIEQAVISAITNAKMEGRDLELKDLYAARKQIVPISTTMEEQVRHIRNWAYDRAVRASKEA